MVMMRTEHLQRQQLEELRQLKAAQLKSPQKSITQLAEEATRRTNTNTPRTTARKSIKNQKQDSVQDESSNSMDSKSSGETPSNDGDKESKEDSKNASCSVTEESKSAAGCSSDVTDVVKEDTDAKCDSDLLDISDKPETDSKPQSPKDDPEKSPNSPKLVVEKESETDITSSILSEASKIGSECDISLPAELPLLPNLSKTESLNAGTNVLKPIKLPDLPNLIVAKPLEFAPAKLPLISSSKLIANFDDEDSQSSEANAEALKLAVASVINYDLEEEEPSDWEDHEPPLDEGEDEVLDMETDKSENLPTETVMLSSDDDTEIKSSSKVLFPKCKKDRTKQLGKQDHGDKNTGQVEKMEKSFEVQDSHEDLDFSSDDRLLLEASSGEEEIQTLDKVKLPKAEDNFASKPETEIKNVEGIEQNKDNAEEEIAEEKILPDPLQKEAEKNNKEDLGHSSLEVIKIDSSGSDADLNITLEPDGVIVDPETAQTDNEVKDEKTETVGELKKDEDESVAKEILEVILEKLDSKSNESEGLSEDVQSKQENFEETKDSVVGLEEEIKNDNIESFVADAVCVASLVGADGANVLDSFNNELQIDVPDEKDDHDKKEDEQDFDMVTVSDSDDVKEEANYRESRKITSRIILDDSDPIKALLEETEGINAEDEPVSKKRMNECDDNDDTGIKKTKVISPVESDDDDDKDDLIDDEGEGSPRPETQVLTVKLLEDLFKEKIKEYVDEENKLTILQLSGRCGALEKSIEKWKKKAQDLETQVVSLTTELQNYKQQQQQLAKKAEQTAASTLLASSSSSVATASPTITAVLKSATPNTKTTPIKSPMMKVGAAVPLALIENTAGKSTPTYRPSPGKSSTFIDLTEEDEDRSSTNLARVKNNTVTLATLPPGATVIQSVPNTSTTLTSQVMTLPMASSSGMVQLIPTTSTASATAIRANRPRFPGAPQTSVGPFSAPPGTQVTYLVPSGAAATGIGNLNRQLLAFSSTAPNMIPGSRPPMQTILVRMNPTAGNVPPGARFPTGNINIPTTSGNVTLLSANASIRSTSQLVPTAPTLNQPRGSSPRGVMPKPQHPAALPPQPTYAHSPNTRSLPPKPALKISKVANGIVLSWNMSVNQTHADISAYQLYAYQEGAGPPSTALWKKVGDVKALPLPMACTLTQFVDGNKYHFAVRAVDVHTRCGPFSDPTHIVLPGNKK